jgi:hypothetical protein
METYVALIINAVTAIIVAWLGARASQDKKDREKRQKAADLRESRREERDKFLLEYMDLSADLAEAQTIAITEGKHNGELTECQRKLTDLRNKYQAWLRGIAVKE